MWRVELAAGVTRVDLVDQHGAQLHLDEAGATKVSALVTLRQQYSVVAICTNVALYELTPQASACVTDQPVCVC